MERLGGKPSQDFVGSSHLLGVAGMGEIVHPPYVVGTVKDLPLPWGENHPRVLQESECVPVLGGMGAVCEQVTTAIKTRGSTSAKSHGITNLIVRLFLVSERLREGRFLNEYF